jgi:hypothetical protein
MESIFSSSVGFFEPLESVGKWLYGAPVHFAAQQAELILERDVLGRYAFATQFASVSIRLIR